MIMIKIIRTKTWNKLQADLRDVRGANIKLNELLKGHYNKFLSEIKFLEKKASDLEKNLRKAEHEKAEAFKKLKKQKDEL